MNTVAATPQDFPVLLSLSAPWDGLLAWVEGEAAPAGGRVGAGGPAMLHRGDHPVAVVRLAPLAPLYASPIFTKTAQEDATEVDEALRAAADPTRRNIRLGARP